MRSYWTKGVQALRTHSRTLLLLLYYYLFTRQVQVRRDAIKKNRVPREVSQTL